MDELERSKRNGGSSDKKADGGDTGGAPGKRSLTQLTEGSVGSPIPATTRKELEQSLGRDLGGVRVHIDAKAAEAAKSLGARAFTVGQGIYFGAGQYNPTSGEGKRLLAHELTHTVQQGNVSTEGPLEVNTPGDSHEHEAEQVADSVINGEPAEKKVTPSPGVIQRAIIQRDLLDGSPPPELDAPTQPIHVKPASSAELAQHAAEAIRKARSEGGTQAVVSMVHTLRNNASGDSRGAVESAIGSELTEDEKKALAGGSANDSSATAANASATTTADKSDPKEPKHEIATKPTTESKKPDAHDGAVGGDKANANKPGDADAKPGGDKPGDKTEAKPGEVGGDKGPGDKAEGGDKVDAKGEEGKEGGGDGKKGKPGDIGKTGDAHTPAVPDEKHHAPPVSAIAGHEGIPDAGVPADAPKVSQEAGKELIEQELAFYDRWKVYQGGAGSRAGHLAQTLFYADGPGSAASKIFHSDLAQGVIGGALWEGGALATRLIATKTPLSRIPGIGNILGGGMSAYILFSNGGAGAKEMFGHMTHGIGGAFSAKNWKDAPFLTAANLVEGIVATLELVGHVCNVLAGLAYAFSAIAAVGGLLSIFFPPLAFLVPYIPVAINFARACGGIATAAFAVTYLVSPIPALLRLMHQIFSDQDPAKLAAEEDDYHSAASGAIACYAAGKFGDQVDKRGIKSLGVEPKPDTPHKTLGSTFIGGNVADIKEGVGVYRQSMDGHLTPGLKGQNFGAGTANVERALGGENSWHQQSKDYFKPEERTAVAHHEKAGEEKKLEKAEGKLDTAKKDQAYVEHRADVAQDRLDAKPTSENFDRSVKASATAERHEGRVADFQGKVDAQHHEVERAEWRTQIPSGLQGEEFGGEMSDGIETLVEQQVYEKPEARKQKMANDAARAVEGGDHPGAPGAPGEHGKPGEEHAPLPLDAKGHIILPDPPQGRLEVIEEIDQAIEKLEHEKKELHATGTDARATQKDASARASGLKHASTDVKQYVAGKQTKSQAEQARIHAQTADMQTKTAQAHSKTSQGANQASGPIRGIAAGARTVDGLLQRIPSNKFFDISSAKNNVHQFVVGMDTIMGADGHNQEQQGHTTAAINDRNQKTAEAATKHGQANTEGNKLASEINADATVAQTASGQAATVADSAKEGETNAESKLGQLKAERAQKWQALLSWAAKHRSLREQVNSKHE